MTYAVGGEDEKILSKFPDGYIGTAVELGACDGVHKSNTLLLEEHGWRCLCIEPSPSHYASLREKRKLWLFCGCDAEPMARTKYWENRMMSPITQGALHVSPHGAWVPSEVTVLTLDQCLMVTGFESLDVLSLDVDGIEEKILAGFDVERWRPKVAVVELNDGATSSLARFFTNKGYEHEGPFSDNNYIFTKEW